MTDKDTLARSYRTSRRLAATPIVLDVSMRCAWNLFYGMARINKWEAARVIADLSTPRRQACWRALYLAGQVDWLDIRQRLNKEFPSSPAAAFRNTHGY